MMSKKHLDQVKFQKTIGLQEQGKEWFYRLFFSDYLVWKWGSFQELGIDKSKGNDSVRIAANASSKGFNHKGLALGQIHVLPGN